MKALTSFDSNSEKRDLEAINDLKKNDNLTVMISHNKNNLIYCDKKF